MFQPDLFPSTDATQTALDFSAAPAPAVVRPVRVALVGCGSQKLTTRAAAADMYTSNLLRLSLAFARANWLKKAAAK